MYHCMLLIHDESGAPTRDARKRAISKSRERYRAKQKAAMR
jgi:hypothetical protein